MQSQKISANGVRWFSLTMIQAKMSVLVNNKELEKTLQERLYGYLARNGVQVAYKDGYTKDYIIVIFPSETVEGMTITSDIIYEKLDEIENDILEAKRQKELLDILI